MKRTARAAAAWIGLGVLVALSAESMHAQAAERADRTVIINFEAVELPVFVKFISKVTGRNFVFTDTAQGLVTVISPTPVSPVEAYTVFQSVLSVRGLTTIDDGVITRIVPIREARQQGAASLAPRATGDGFTTRLIPLANVDVRALGETLAPLVSREGALVAYPPTNTLIISDLLGNTARIAEVVAALDRPSPGATVEVIGLEHADAVTTAQQVMEILSQTAPGKGPKAQQAGGPDAAMRIVPDERTNSLIVTASVVDLRQVRELVASLDTELREAEKRIRVYYAKHADAEDLVEVLSAIIAGGAARGRRGGARAQAADPRPPGAQGRLGLAEEVSVSADPATNAVIIDAPPRAYEVVLGLLEDLDIQRAQVFVEAIIVEVTVDRSRELGFEFQGGGDIGDEVAIGAANLANLGALTSGVANPFSLSGLILAAASDRTVELANGQEVPANVALFRALAEDSDVNVLSAPTLLTLDNQEAEIVVGQNVPFVTSRGVDISAVNNVFTTVERRDVGVRLRVTPQVSEGDSVILTVDEEVSAIVPNALLDANTVGPTTTIRSASTTVSVADGRTAVIGGLISDSVIATESRVPVLSRIPLLGALFRAEGKRKGKVNLIAFLTPHVIRNADDLRRATSESERKYRDSLAEIPKTDRWERPDAGRWLPGTRTDPSKTARHDITDPWADEQAETPSVDGAPGATDEALESVDDYRDRF